MITDHQRFLFLQKLDLAVRAANGLLLDDWENRFFTSWLQSSNQTTWFTAGRRVSLDKMWNKYGAEINHPLPLAEAPAAKHLPPATPDGCEFIVLNDDRQFVRCNAPAEFVNRRAFRYCSAHAEQVQKDLKRRGGVMELRTFIPDRGLSQPAARESSDDSVSARRAADWDNPRSAGRPTHQP